MLKIELYKVIREIKINGDIYIFYRKSTDSYGEETKDAHRVCDIKGLFHTSKGYITRNIQDATISHSKGQPKLLVEYKKASEIKNGDFLIINNNTYKVIEKNNIQEYNIVSDISLELVINGNN